MKIVLMAVLAFLFFATFATQIITPVRAAETPRDDTIDTFKPPRYFVDAVDTYFEISDSTYLNITLISTETVHLILESVPRMVSFVLEGNSSATSTIVTFSGFMPSTTYYRYQDGYLMENFTTDLNGGYIYTQDTSERHQVIIQENTSTIYITSDYTFTENLYETIVVAADNITIDGNGYKLQGPGYGLGFSLYDRSGVTIKNVIVEGWTYGIILQYSSSNTILENTVASNFEGIILWPDSYNNVLQDNNVSNNQAGMDLSDSSSNILKNNNVSNNMYSIYLWNSGNSTLENNHISNSTFASIVFYYSPNNTLIGNTISNVYVVRLINATNNRYGIVWQASAGNTLRNNSMIGNTFNFGDGVTFWGGYDNKLFDFIHDIDTSNTVDGRPVYYWVNQRDKQVPLDAGYVGLVNCTNITVKDLILKKNLQGVSLAYTTNSRIENISALYNSLGIHLEHSNGNIVNHNILSSNGHNFYIFESNKNSIHDNTISAAGWGRPWPGPPSPPWQYIGIGTFLVGSANNTFYHNNIINNEIQAYDTNPADNDWHHPTLLEGSYWSDYTGVDDGSGTDKHAVVGDGIGDTDIPWPASDYDFYPFTSSWGWLKLEVDSYLTDSDFKSIAYFDVVFSKDRSGGYKLVATNPGQFYYNIEVINKWPTTVESLTIDVSIPANFTLKGAVPIHVYQDEVDITETTQISRATITLGDVPTGSKLYITVHIDYALKGTTYESLDDFELKGYILSLTVSGNGGSLSGTYASSATLIAHTKKVTAIAGFVTDTYENPITGAIVELFDSQGNLIASTVTDENGFYYLINIPTGDYTVQITYNSQVYIQTAAALSRELTQVDFKIE